jgi:hypothetical protein
VATHPLPAPAMFAIFATFGKFGKFGKFATFATFATVTPARESPGWDRRQVEWATTGE